MLVPSRTAIHRTGPWLAASASVAIVLLGCGGQRNAGPSLYAEAARGREVAERAGCAACHGSGDDAATVGPTWVGSWGTTIDLDDGRTAVFDADYVRRSVRAPDADRRLGDWLRMPTFGPDQVTDDELGALVAYVRALGGAG